MSARDPEADLARLEEEVLSLQRRREAFDAKIDARVAEKHKQAAAIRTFLELRAVYGADPEPKPRSLPPDSPFYGKTIAEAGAVLLRQMGRPLTEEEIIDGLRDAGVPMVSVNPIVNFRMAARRRVDLLFNHAGRWYLTESDDAEARSASTGCVPNRSRELHMAKTLEGLAAARARGVVGGRRSTLPPGTREQALRMVASLEDGGEGLSVRETAARLGISRPVVYKIIRAAKAQPSPNGHAVDPGQDEEGSPDSGAGVD